MCKQQGVVTPHGIFSLGILYVHAHDDTLSPLRPYLQPKVTLPNGVIPYVLT